MKVRLSRLFDSSNTANRYFLSTSSGIRQIQGRKIRNQYKDNWLPKPAFVVPTILESLRSLQRYREITHLVPGEADPFCAEDVRKNGGTLLTGDSDLVLYDLGTAGSVVFFHDLDVGKLPTEVNAVEIAEGRRLVSAVTYRQSEICRRLSLKPGQEGILPLAFEIKSGLGYSPASRALQSDWQYLDPSRASEYVRFVSQYQNLPALQLTVPKYMSVLDPRVSEFILEWEQMAESGSETLGDGPEKRPVVYLPQLLDRWDLLSSWNPSMPIRQLVYSLCWGGKAAASAVVEYGRTLSKRSNGQVVEMLAGSRAPEALDGFLGFLGSFVNGTTGSTKSQWITVCLSLEIGHTASAGRESTALKLWQKASEAEGRLDAGDWDAVHLVAHIQGTLWSLRMLQQVLKCRVGYLVKTPDLTDHVDRLEACLSTLPPIAEFPCASDMGTIFAQLDQAGTLKTLAEYTGIDEPVLLRKSADEGAPKDTKQGKRDGKQQKQQKPQAKKSSAANSFNALSVEY